VASQVLAWVCFSVTDLSVTPRMSFPKYLRKIYFCMRFSRYILTVIDSLPNGDGEIRTLDPLLARQVLSQLSYTPTNRDCYSILISLSANGLEWTRTTDLTLIRRAL